MKYLSEVQCILLVSDNFPKINDVLVIELTQDFYLSNRRDGEALFLILQPDLLQSYKYAGPLVSRFIHLSISTFSNLCDKLKHVHATFTPIFATGG